MQLTGVDWLAIAVYFLANIGIGLYYRRRIAREAADVVPTHDVLVNLVDWFAGCVFVYMSLFGVGKIIFGRTLLGVSLLLVGAVAAAAIFVDLNRRGWKTVLE